jgi:hypothetical protein
MCFRAETWHSAQTFIKNHFINSGFLFYDVSLDAQTEDMSLDDIEEEE